MKTYVEIRGQSPVGTFPRQGPDRYVAVQVVPDGVEKLGALNRTVAEKRGIEIIYCGEGYSKSRKAQRSTLSVAIAIAEKIASGINNRLTRQTPTSKKYECTEVAVVAEEHRAALSRL